MTDVGHKPGREKTGRYIADNIPDPAPVKGATCSPISYAAQRRSFNPRTCKGCDFSIPPADSVHSGFNPRPREGATGSSRSSKSDIGCFNPRPREGATAPLSGPVNRAFQRHFARTSFFSPENKGGFPNIFYFTCIFNRLAMRASHRGKPVHLGCPHRQTG